MESGAIQRDKGYLPFTRENRKFQLENQMVRVIPFGKLQKIWAVIRGDAIFLLFEVSLADVDIFYNNSLSRRLAFNCFMFMPEISNWMVFINGKHPRKVIKKYHNGKTWTVDGKIFLKTDLTAKFLKIDSYEDLRTL